MGFEGQTLSPSTRATITREKPALFILFGQNYAFKEQLIELNDELQTLVKENGDPLPAIISVDQEGGRVQRFRNGFTLLPPAMRVGALTSTNSIFEITQIQAKELFAAGIQLNFAPDCDINTNPANPVIGDRAYGDTEAQVSRAVTAVVRGHLTQGVEACLKHFPGHGDTHVDSHDSLPMVTTPLETLRKREWIPFHKAMKSGANFLMSAHILLPEIDATRPGTFSETFLSEYLRKELHFNGVVVSDDMQMGAVINTYGKEEAPILALKAGCDLLCYRHEPETLIALEAIKKAIKDKVLDAKKLQASIDRVRKVRANLELAKDQMTQEERLDIIGNPAHAEFIKKCGIV